MYTWELFMDKIMQILRKNYFCHPITSF